MIRETISELAPQLLATRMLRDYVQRALPADGRGSRVGRRGPLSFRRASRARGYNRAVHDEEAR